MLIYLIFNKTPCIYELKPFDNPQGPSLFMCVDQSPGVSGLALFIIFGIIFLYEVLLGFMFVYKLHHALKSMEQNTMRLRDTIIKNTILYVATLASTLTFYILWFMDIGHVSSTLHFDTLLNCVMIALMYHYNERYYQCLCGKCSRYFRRLYARTESRTRLKSVASKTNTTTPTSPVVSDTEDIPMELQSNTVATLPRMITPKSVSPERSVCGLIITNYADDPAGSDDEEP